MATDTEKMVSKVEHQKVKWVCPRCGSDDLEVEIKAEVVERFNAYDELEKELSHGWGLFQKATCCSCKYKGTNESEWLNPNNPENTTTLLGIFAKKA